MATMVEVSYVKELFNELLPWEREEFLDEFRPYEEPEEEGKIEDEYDAIYKFGAEDLLDAMDFVDIVRYYEKRPDEFKALTEAMK